MYKPIIKQSGVIKIEDNKMICNIPDLDFNRLKKVNLKDKRKANNYNYKEDITEISKNSKMPIPGLLMDFDDNQNNDWIAPHSDWVGPTGEAWINR